MSWTHPILLVLYALGGVGSVWTLGPIISQISAGVELAYRIRGVVWVIGFVLWPVWWIAKGLWWAGDLLVRVGGAVVTRLHG